MDYVVKTEVFEGPFDLLLHLIARQRVDLWQVSLSRITEDYLAEVRRMRELNLEVATEFLVVAATLLELKAARLLPDDLVVQLPEHGFRQRLLADGGEGGHGWSTDHTSMQASCNVISKQVVKNRDS